MSTNAINPIFTWEDDYLENNLNVLKGYEKGKSYISHRSYKHITEGKTPWNPFSRYGTSNNWEVIEWTLKRANEFRTFKPSAPPTENDLKRVKTIRELFAEARNKLLEMRQDLEIERKGTLVGIIDKILADSIPRPIIPFAPVYIITEKKYRGGNDGSIKNAPKTSEQSKMTGLKLPISDAADLDQTRLKPVGLRVLNDRKDVSYPKQAIQSRKALARSISEKTLPKENNSDKPLSRSTPVDPKEVLLAARGNLRKVEFMTKLTSETTVPEVVSKMLDQAGRHSNPNAQTAKIVQDWNDNSAVPAVQVSETSSKTKKLERSKAKKLERSTSVNFKPGTKDFDPTQLEQLRLDKRAAIFSATRNRRTSIDGVEKSV